MSKERYIIVGTCTIKDTLTNDYIDIDESCELLNQQNQRITELEKLLINSLENNNDLLRQIMELQSQLIKERLKG